MATTGKIYKIISANPKGPIKRISLASDGQSNVVLSVPRFALVGKGDKIAMGAAGNSKIHVIPADGLPGIIPVTPRFTHLDQVKIGSQQIEFKISEINSISDLGALEFLEQFHYKTNSSLYDEETGEGASGSTGGRRGILLACLRIGKRWVPAGYIELQMPLMMCKPRHDLFRHPFDHPFRPVQWKIWDQHAIRQHLNLIVRIGRIVVSPELRGLGIARNLILVAKKYATQRWHIGGRRPLFMEISAEMLNHVDFVSSVGFSFSGRTEGNIERVVKDMEQMAHLPNGEFGMMSLQRKYFKFLEDYCKTLQISFDEGVEILRKKIENRNKEALSSSDWAALRGIIRHPIPYFLCPLDDYSKTYLKSALKANPPSGETQGRVKPFSVRAVQINISEVSIRARYDIPKSRSTQIIMDAFSLNGDVIFADLLPATSVKASNGNIVLVVGSSGSGKSVFLQALDPTLSVDGNLRITLLGERNYTAGWLREIRSDVPLFEALADKFSPPRAFAALSRVGLSEAFAFIKPFWMLSRGQQYRAMMAELLLRDEEVWLLDEFCSDLDPLTAKIVAHNLRKQAISTGRIVFVAAANHTHFVDALRPTRVLYMRQGDQPNWLSYKEYQSEFLDVAI